MKKDSSHFKKLQILKLKLAESTSLEPVLTYFYDHVSNDQEFIELGQPARHDLLESVIHQVVGQQLLKIKKSKVDQFMLLHIPDYHFYHGGCILNGLFTQYIYFDDIDVGVIVVLLPDMSTARMRFSVVAAPGRPKHPQN